ncbi:hypothetical protein [Bacillus benzoevorans]|uniref:Glucan phosphoethanolaminetransferase (Alkaline phosphatase superfamily) n=1 Tax=Bacillus benzoevorans TaxID=1456 RepID=A0A7X0LTY8_9BACI|nr:hypothetical protein [Bacillus benzoevorans]MBB6443998.1 glucan phosphoethanolaminetransferase (alkaline phosphatase superfamily) [Bacillus benzoevorans]
MSQKKKVKTGKKRGKKQRNMTIKERIINHPLFVALIGILVITAFAWAYETIGVISFLVFLVSVLATAAIGILMIYLFFTLIEEMRKGHSYTVFNTDTPMKRFFEYVFITIFTLGIGIFFLIIAVKNVLNAV